MNMDNKIEKLIDKIENIKNKLKDIEYIEIMENIRDIYVLSRKNNNKKKYKPHNINDIILNYPEVRIDYNNNDESMQNDIDDNWENWFTTNELNNINNNNDNNDNNILQGY